MNDTQSQEGTRWVLLCIGLGLSLYITYRIVAAVDERYYASDPRFQADLQSHQEKARAYERLGWWDKIWAKRPGPSPNTGRYIALATLFLFVTLFVALGIIVVLALVIAAICSVPICFQRLKNRWHSLTIFFERKRYGDHGKDGQPRQSPAGNFRSINEI